MSLPIPYHLREIAEEIKCCKETLTLQLRCTCGCERFSIFENAYTKEEKEKLRPYDEALKQIYTGSGTHYCTQDADGTLHYWKKRLFHKPEEYFLPECPPFAYLHRITLRCAECGAEYVLFDNRYHGYDGAICGTEVPLDYQPQMKQKFKQQFPERRIRVVLETITEAEFAEVMDGAPGTENLFSECFSWITALAENAKGNYRIFFECETA